MFDLDPELIAAYKEKLGIKEDTNGLKSPDLASDSLFQMLVQTDLELMTSHAELDLADEVMKILLVQSILGHCHNGHSFFGGPDSAAVKKFCSKKQRQYLDEQGRTKYVYPHATMSDIILAAGLDLQQTKNRRQKLIEDVFKWVDLALDGRPQRLTLNNKPLLGVNFLREHHIDPTFVLKGMVLAGYMDKYLARMETLNHFDLKTLNKRPLRLGGGETYPVNPKALAMAGLDYDFLAYHEHDLQDLQYLRKLGVIVPNGSSCSESAYIRRTIGPGTSDDLAFIIIGTIYGEEEINHGISAMLGAFVTDAVDTYDKCVSYPSEKGFDELLAEYIQEQWKRKTNQQLVSNAEIKTVIYLAAKKNTPVVNVSSSHRRLVQFEGEAIYHPTIVQHMAHLKNEPTGDYRVGFGRMKSQNFYARATKRQQAVPKTLERAI